MKEVSPLSNTIVLALDGAERSGAAKRHATDLAHERGARIVVVHVKELMGAAERVLCTPTRMSASVRFGIRSPICARGFETDLRVVSSLRRPAALISDAAKMSSADMIVVGGTTHGAIMGALAGSTPMSLLHSSPCPVLVAPARETAAPSLPESTDAGRTSIAA